MLLDHYKKEMFKSVDRSGNNRMDGKTENAQEPPPKKTKATHTAEEQQQTESRVSSEVQINPTFTTKVKAPNDPSGYDEVYNRMFGEQCSHIFSEHTQKLLHDLKNVHSTEVDSLKDAHAKEIAELRKAHQEALTEARKEIEISDRRASDLIKKIEEQKQRSLKKEKKYRDNFIKMANTISFIGLDDSDED